MILGKGSTQGLEHQCIKKCIQLILLKITKNFVWACIIIERTVFYLLMVQKFLNSKQAIDFRTVATPLWRGNISKHWSVDNMKRTLFNGYVYDFSVDYDAIAIDDILDNHKHSTKKNVWVY